MRFRDLKVGDQVTRMLGDVLPMQLTITELTDDLIKCGDWEFDRHYGYEVDDYLGWGKQADGSVHTGSYLLIP